MTIFYKIQLYDYSKLGGFPLEATALLNLGLVL